MDRLRFILGTVSNFDLLGINTETNRKSLDGTKALVHQETLTDEQFETIRYDETFQFISNGALDELLNTAEWSDV